LVLSIWMTRPKGMRELLFDPEETSTTLPSLLTIYGEFLTQPL